MTIGAVLNNDASIIFFATDHTVVWLDTVSYCYTNSLAIEYTFFEELFAAIILIFMKCRFYTIYAHKNK